MNENPYRQMIDWFDGGNRWVKHNFAIFADGEQHLEGYQEVVKNPQKVEQACLLGCSAMHGVARDTACGTRVDSLKKVIAEQYEEMPVHVFNDLPSTEWEDVERILEKAAVQWDETH